MKPISRTAAALLLGGLAWGCQEKPGPFAPDTAEPDAPALPDVVAVQVDPAGGGGGGPTGAIFTTTPDGGIVNENVHYQNKLFVYLDGGPPPNAPQTAAGLDDGLYVFQVTDPSGWVLLSMDPSKCRVVSVTNGIITELVKPSDLPAPYGPLTDDYEMGNGAHAETFPCHIADAPTPPDPAGPDDAGASGRHDTNVDVDHGADGAIVVQLMPYGTTPNPGGVYKAWVTPIATYVNRGGELDELPDPIKGRAAHDCPDACFDNDPGFGPPRSVQKTDNFKVKEAPPRIEVFKFEDLNGNGVRDEGEPEITGWEIFVTETLYDGTTITNVCYTPCGRTVAPGATVTVSEELPGDWYHSSLSVDGTPVPITSQPTPVDVLFEPGDMLHTVVFGNFEFSEKSGHKFHDMDANGVRDEGEPGLENWTIQLAGTDGMGNAVAMLTVTDENGYYEFTMVPPGSYTVSEVCPDGWHQSVPEPTDGCGSGTFAVTFQSGDAESDNDFGNYQFATKSGMKFHDLNGNGEKNVGEPGLAGWTIQIWMGETKVAETTTADGTGDDPLGFYSFEVAPGTYTVKEVCPGGWYQSVPAPTDGCGSGVHEVTLVSQQVHQDNDFGNFQFATKSGMKFHDMNANGVKDEGDDGLPNWTIRISGTDGMGNDVSDETTTDAEGNYSFSVPPGTYTVSEVCPDDWEQSVPAAPLGSCGAGVYDVTLASQEVDSDNDFGNFMLTSIHAHKFFDLNENGVPDPGEGDLEGIEFCLYEGDPAGALISCQTTNADGLVWWMDLMPGTYTVVETLPYGWFSTTGVSQSVTLLSGETAELEFGNVANCVGLTPGYWVNWRNHYTEAQFLLLLEGTIAEGDVALADYYLTSQGCDDGDALHCMRRFLLANQLTLNLTQHPELPNPSDGSLFTACQVPGADGNLGYWLEQALEIHAADGVGFEREVILWVKTVLDWFANLFLVVI